MDILTEVLNHYAAWTDDMDKELTREGGMNDVTDAYYGKLPDNWPFLSRTTDPRIRTAILEKNARLVNGKLRGRLVPRENGDVLGARINNAVIDYQWDSANDGGSMTTKIAICDIDTRLYKSKFALVKWKYEEKDGKVIFCGNEMYPLDIRDCGIDYNATHIRDAVWFQHRSWEYLEELENQSDVDGKPIFKNISKIKSEIKKKSVEAPSDKRSNAYTSRIKELRGKEDRSGTDPAFPVLEVVTEYRRDRWITFLPQYATIIRDIPNPYKHGKIPVAQLRYYPIQDDPLGESEVEAVIPLWKAIQATVCGYMDEVMLKMRPPLKVIEGAARIETIQYGPEVQWLVTRPDAITEMQSNGEAVRYFQTTYSALVSAFNQAMGMMSQGTGGIDPFNPQKTATEVRASVSQQNARDQKNQQDLIEFIKDIVLMWLANNKQFLFQDPDKHELVMRIVGNDNFEYFKRAGLDQMYVPDEAMTMISDIVTNYPDMTDLQLQELYESAKVPKFPVYENPKEKDPAKIRMKAKMEVNDMGDGAKLYITPDDIVGEFDYIADVKSMSVGADMEMTAARQEAIQLVTTNPNVVQLLSLEGYRPKVKDLLVANFEDKGLRDADRFFEKYEQSPTQAGNPQMGSPLPNGQVGGIPGVSQTDPRTSPAQQMAGPAGAGQQPIPQV